jgi:two-component system cell cycle response regulator CtrA
MLTARDDETDKLVGLGVGADDYMTKPFSMRELVARVNGLVRRVERARALVGHAPTVGSLKFAVSDGELEIDRAQRRVRRAGSEVHLTGKEYAMLELLSLRKGTTLTKEMFLNHLYGGMDEPELKIIDVFICKLRKKLSLACDGDNYIETVWGRGYVLRDPQEQTAAAVA